jgi:demethylmenaquinone methyltransferase / 2-methoxy-6-polyprenyl-1,4-benzoquinol methylase
MSETSRDIPPDETDFGFRAVPRAEKKSLVRAVFKSVAPRYDLMNDLMSLGIHRAWKQIFTSLLDPRPGRRLLDLAGGTGDISFGWLRRGGGPAILSDINLAMLEVGRNRAIDRGLIGDLRFLVADAEALPIPSGTMDVVTIAFGLRNCTDKAAVLAEARRVLRPGGRFFWKWRRLSRFTRLGPLRCFRGSAGYLPATPRAISTWRRASGCFRTSRNSRR